MLTYWSLHVSPPRWFLLPGIYIRRRFSILLLMRKWPTSCSLPPLSPCALFSAGCLLAAPPTPILFIFKAAGCFQLLLFSLHRMLWEMLYISLFRFAVKSNYTPAINFNFPLIGIGTLGFAWSIIDHRAGDLGCIFEPLCFPKNSLSIYFWNLWALPIIKHWQHNPTYSFGQLEFELSHFLFSNFPFFFPYKARTYSSAI